MPVFCECISPLIKDSLNEFVMIVFARFKTKQTNKQKLNKLYRESIPFDRQTDRQTVRQMDSLRVFQGILAFILGILMTCFCYLRNTCVIFVYLFTAMHVHIVTHLNYYLACLSLISTVFLVRYSISMCLRVSARFASEGLPLGAPPSHVSSVK